MVISQGKRVKSSFQLHRILRKGKANTYADGKDLKKPTQADMINLLTLSEAQNLVMRIPILAFITRFDHIPHTSHAM
jgi:hypothetical protein